MASDLESVTVAIANQNLNEKEVLKNGDHASLNSEDTEDAGGFGQLSESNGLGSSYARMPVEKDAVRYNMNHPSRGHCVIFNHSIFDSHTGLGARNGTDKDRDQAQQLFKNLGYKVAVYNNEPVERIKEVIQDLAFGVDHKDCDSLVIVFMSHGEQEILYGRNGSFKAEFLFDSFSADQCKSLAGKPKLFFIQACRGEGLDPGTTLVNTGPKDETDAGSLSYKIPNTADFLICWSTVPGHFSWRNTTNGSWFIQSLVRVLSAQSAHDDLLSMMTDVNRYMILHFESNCPSQQHMHGKKQVASIVSTLMRKVYLTPKY
ncbi:caspase-1-like [Palaemon carinicauda]|uniref:caspase-1-like n=1 Tax=Palaemon carinicauda TaxID=392227 RepID=UPI0035B69D25